MALKLHSVGMSQTSITYKNALKLLIVGAGLIAGLWFMYETISILFLFFFALVIAMVLNAPVMWLLRKGWSRTAAGLLVFFALVVFIVGLFWLVIPRILEQGSSLVYNLPSYLGSLQHQVANLLKDYPTLQQDVMKEAFITDNLPSLRKVFLGVGQLSLSLLQGLFLLVIFLSIVAYILLNPEPLIRTLLGFFSPAKRIKVANSLSQASTMMVGWIWSNFVVGLMDAIIVFLFLSYMNVPGVWIWAGLALFGEMIPRIGWYIMAVPPTLIAFSISPTTALWVLVFYLLLSEIMGDFVIPRIRAKAMNLHAVATLFALMTMVAAFGFFGALVATPAMAFVKSFYDNFYGDQIDDKEMKKEVAIVMERKKR